MVGFPYEMGTRIRRQRVYDPMSDQHTLSDWAAADRTEIDGILFAPGTSADFPNVDLEEVSMLATIYIEDEDADIRESDRIEIRDATWTVVGKPGAWAEEGIVVNLRWLRDEAEHG